MTTFNVYRREVSDTNPPVAIATGLTSRNYTDATAIIANSYLYSIGAVKNGVEVIGDEAIIFAGGDIYWNDVDLLIYADGTNAISTSIVDSSLNTKVISVIGGAKLVKSKFGGECALVDKYAKWTTTGAQLLTADFTIEFWYHSISGGTANGRILSYSAGGAGSLLINKSANTASSDLNILINNGSYQTVLTTSDRPITGNGWQHICLQRIAGSFYLFVDGVLSGSSAAYKTYSITDTAFSYNGWSPSATDYHHGLFGSCRVTKGIARYALSGFSMPTSEFQANAENDPYFSSVDLLLISSSTSITDKSNNNRSIVAAGSAYYIPGKKFDDAVIFLDGDGGGITAATSTLGTNDFTLEFFINVKSSSKSFPRIGQIGNADSINGCVFVTTVGTTWGTDFHFWSGSGYQAFAGFSGLNKNHWYHICLMRKAGSFYVFVDGVLKTSNSSAPFNTYNFTTTTLMLGRGAASSTDVQCGFSGIRLTLAARYNTAGFTVPSKKFSKLA